jgi:hypothetical protein
VQSFRIFALSALAVGALLPIACTQDFGVFEPTASGDPGSTSTSTSTTGTGGSGGALPCTDAGCDDMDPCTVDVCDAATDTCMHLPTSCGGCTDPGECPDPGECKAATCVDQQCGAANAPEGDSCTGGVCNDVGSCVECLTSDDCDGGDGCSAENVCVDRCMDGVQDGNETDIDCGGDTCTGCPDGQSCQDDQDCLTDSCINDICGPPTCTDGVENADEADIDCGGGTCPLCRNGDSCLMDSDCASGDCKNGQNVCT